MFENGSVMVLKANTKSDEVLRIELNNETQNAIGLELEDALKALVEEKTIITFDGSYKPNEDEILVINLS